MKGNDFALIVDRLLCVPLARYQLKEHHSKAVNIDLWCDWETGDPFRCEIANGSPHGYVGYAHNSSAYRFLVHKSDNTDIHENKIIESRNASFFENQFHIKLHMKYGIIISSVKNKNFVIIMNLTYMGFGLGSRSRFLG